MVGGPATAAAVELARRLPRLAVGLHLTLVDGRPILPAHAVFDLVDRRGRFRANMALTGAAMFLLPSVRRQMLAEVRAQFKAFRDTGLTLDHVNAHKHYHLHPSILSAILAMATEFGVRDVRVPLEPSAILGRIDGTRPDLTAAALNLWGYFQRARLRRAGIATPDQVFGLAWSGAVSHLRLARLIANLPEGVTEVYTHPAISSAFPGAAPNYRYEEELAALTSTELRREIVAAGIVSGGFADAARWREASG
jgi:hopanoid biosynthesis associated protein HpnK